MPRSAEHVAGTAGLSAPERREKFIFKAAGLGRVGGRAAVMIDYRSVKPEEPKVEWKEECVSIDLPGRARGRIWADPETAEILRLDEGIVGLVDIAVPRKQQRMGGIALHDDRARGQLDQIPSRAVHRSGRDTAPSREHRDHDDRQELGQPESPHLADLRQLPPVCDRLPHCSVVRGHAKIDRSS